MNHAHGAGEDPRRVSFFDLGSSGCQGKNILKTTGIRQCFFTGSLRESMDIRKIFEYSVQVHFHCTLSPRTGKEYR